MRSTSALGYSRAVSDGGLEMPDEVARHDYDGKCWWCSDVANSREHKWKASELREIFGKGDYGREVVWASGDDLTNLRSARSSGAKFSATMCVRCNNERSQPFDYAYSEWSSYAIRHHDDIVATRRVNFEDVFGDQTPEKLPLLARYYVKHICCRLAEDRIAIPTELICFLDGDVDRLTSVTAQLGVREEIHEMMEGPGPDAFGVWMRPSMALFSASRLVVTDFMSGIGLGAIELLYAVITESMEDRDPGPGVLENPVQQLSSFD